MTALKLHTFPLDRLFAPVEAKPIVTKRDRKCLLCTKPFPSHGPGHRVCKRCKASNTWREGNMLTG